MAPFALCLMCSIALLVSPSHGLAAEEEGLQLSQPPRLRRQDQPADTANNDTVQTPTTDTQGTKKANGTKGNKEREFFGKHGQGVDVWGLGPAVVYLSIASMSLLLFIVVSCTFLLSRTAPLEELIAAALATQDKTLAQLAIAAGIVPNSESAKNMAHGENVSAVMAIPPFNPKSNQLIAGESQSSLGGSDVGATESSMSLSVADDDGGSVVDMP